MIHVHVNWLYNFTIQPTSKVRTQKRDSTRLAQCTVYIHTYTVEPPNKQHIESFVVLSLEVENALVQWERDHLGP